MGRARLNDTDLPACVYLKHGTYYFVSRGKWSRIGKTLDQTKIDRLKELTDPKALSGLRKYLVKRIQTAKSNAKQRGLSFDITEDDIVTMAEAQGWACAVTGVPFSMTKRDDMRYPPFAPSIDRINHLIGYTQGNCRIVTAAVNIARSDLPDDVFHLILLEGGRRVLDGFRQSKTGNM